MSHEFEDYSAVSQLYDHTRVPVGVDRIVGWLASAPVPLGQQVVLDAGCGTGNYLQMLAGHVGKLHGMDRNPDMLERARDKLGAMGALDSVVLELGSVTDMPYADAYFNAVLCNQVIHHLEDGNDPAFAHIRAFFAHVRRVLEPGGLFIINTSSHEQCIDGFWWAELIPEAMNRLMARLPSIPRLHDMLADAGFVVEDTVTDRDELLQGGDYLDPLGPLEERWRSGESTWSLATREELDRALERVRDLDQRGQMQAYVASREQLRRGVGQTTFVRARRE